MDDRLKKLILSAWRENRLAGLHVDLSNEMHLPTTAMAYPGVRDNAAFCRQIGVPNIWLAESDRSRLSTVRQFGIFDLKSRRLHPSVGAAPQETLIAKRSGSPFHRGSKMFSSETHLERHAQKAKIDTFLIDGIYADCCVLETLLDGVCKTVFNLVALTNCMDLKPAEANRTYIDMITNLTEPRVDASHRVFLTRLDAIKPLFGIVTP